jgi:hypothetical protein
MITYQEVEQAEESYLVASEACDLDQTEENELALDAAYEAFFYIQSKYACERSLMFQRPTSNLTPEKIKSILLTQK